MPAMVNRRVLYTLFSALVILGGTFVAIQYAKGGFRLNQGKIVPNTGLLSANSFPTGAEVLVDGKLVTATDDTLYLEPGVYNVEIDKDGYWPWKKTLQIEKELVTQTNAQLYPATPSLTPLTFTGLENIWPSPDGQRLIYYTASASAKTKNGLYLLDMSNNPLSSLQRGPKLIADDVKEFNLANAHIIWSPDSSDVLLLSGNHEVQLNLDRKNDLASLPDLSFSRKQLLSDWESEMYQRERQFLNKFPDEVVQVATQSAVNVYLSPDKKRLLYTVTKNATLADNLVPPVPAANTQPQERQLEPGSTYVYDREEDRNFKLQPVLNNIASNTQAGLPDKKLLMSHPELAIAATNSATTSRFHTLQASSSAQTAWRFETYHSPLFIHDFQWLPDSRHLMYIADGNVQVIEYDSTNDTTLYSGPFNPDFVYPWPDGGRLLILTSFSPETPANLYAIELKK